MNRQKALILLADGFEDVQFHFCLYRLREAGVETVIASPNGAIVTGLHGYRVETDMPIHETNPSEYTFLMIPGGSSPEKLRQREEAVSVTRTFFEESRLVGAVGHGPQLLISAGVVDGRRLTCAPGIRDDVRVAGGGYREEAVVVDAGLVTSRGNDDLPAFARAVARLLSEATVGV